MLADVPPRVEAAGEPAAVEEDAPVDDGDDEGERDDGGVEERVQRLEGPGEAVEQGAGGEGVGEGVDGGDEEVEGEAPVGEDGEEGEGVGGGGAGPVGGVGAPPGEGEEEGDEGVDALLDGPFSQSCPVRQWEGEQSQGRAGGVTVR